MTQITQQAVVVLASGNAGKLRELRGILAPLTLELRSQADFDTPEAVEDGLSFVENALIKARNAARHTGLPALADDSGLAVDSLEGAPGIHSARFAGGGGDQANNDKLLAQLGGLPRADRSAQFHCALVYMRHWQDPTPIICQGRWEGYILQQPSGKDGFGYDPLFYVPGEDCSAAELDPVRKNTLSHRAQASVALVEALRRE